jgi:hypothetical protein
VAPPTRDIGTIDLRDVVGTTWSDINELVPDLQWPLSVQMYARMRHDPKLTAILNAYSLPIRRATWAVDPAGCRDEVVQVVADDLGLPILGGDREPSGARRRGVVWGEHLRLALLSLVYGHAVFERRYEIRNNQARLVNLGERMPWTIAEIKLARDGTIAGITQQLAAAAEIPANRLLWYAHDREGANWVGRSLLRPAYGPWILKHEMWRVHATSNRRFGMGVPNVEAPPGATPGQVIEAQRLASAIRVGDQSGAGLPNGFTLKLTGLTGSVPDTVEFIRYLDQQMSQAALAGFLDLGQTETGSRALGESFLDLFMLSLQAVADELALVATSGQPGLTGAVTDLVDLNWGEDEPAPRVVCTDVGERKDLTAQGVTELVTAGVITPDPDLEVYLRRVYQLPEPAPAPAAPRPTPPPQPTTPVTARAGRRRRTKRQASIRAAGDEEAGHRQLTTVEAASGMDPGQIQEDWATALEELLAQWEELSAAQQEELAAQVQAAIEADDLEALAELQVDTGPAAELLAAAMIAAAGVGIAQVIAEAATQDVKISKPAVDEDTLTQLAAAITTIMGSATADAAGREALRVWAADRSGAEVADLVREHMKSLTDAWPREQLGGALWAGQAEGRWAAINSAPKATYVASEVLDVNTCKSCADIDGTEFETKAEAGNAYAAGGYIRCEGRLRCRGIVIAVWD